MIRGGQEVPSPGDDNAGTPCACRSVSTVVPDPVGPRLRQLWPRMRRQTPEPQRHHTETMMVLNGDARWDARRAQVRTRASERLAA